MLIIFFFYNTIGFFLISPLAVSYYKHVRLQEITDNCREDLIEEIILKKEDLLSRKIDYIRINRSEFRLNGTIYDVVKEIDTDSLIYFYCINDKNENLLENKLHNMEESSRNKSEEPIDSNNLNLQLSEAVNYLTLEQANTCFSQLEYFDEVINYQVCRDIPTPPPKSVSSI